MTDVTVAAPASVAVARMAAPNVSLTVSPPRMRGDVSAQVPTIRANATVFLVDGFAFTGFLRLTKIAQQLGANLNQFVQVPYNNSAANSLPAVTAAVNTLDGLLNNPSYGGQKIVVGISMGTQVAYKWIRDKSATSPIGPSQLSFVLLANPENKYTGVTVSTSAFGVGYGGSGIPDSCPYSVQNFVRQYDGVGDYPNRSNPNSTALQNAWLGMAVLHNNYFYVGLNDNNNYSYSEGPTNNLTYTWSRTYPMPISGGMNDIWQFFNTNPVPAVGSSAQVSDQVNRPIVESAYNRPVNIPTPTPSLVLPLLSATAKMRTPVVSITPAPVNAPRMLGSGAMPPPTVA